MPSRARFFAILLVFLSVPVHAGADTHDVIRRDIAPATVDPDSTAWLEPHVVAIDPSATQTGYLFVHLAGSFGRPDNSLLILERAARRGFHAIGLRYPNSWTVNDLCDGSGDADCFEKVRREIFDGTDRTPLVTIPLPDCLEHRLFALLSYLHDAYPDEGWDRFLDGTQPAWARIVLSGHSQGGGHAALLGQLHKTARVAMFAAPSDYDGTSRLMANWVSRRGLTGTDRYFGFSHVRDAFQLRVASWQLMGLEEFGAPVLVDDSMPPYLGAHALFTDAEPARPGEEHGSVVTDRNTPKRPDGSPVFDVVWDVICFDGVSVGDTEAPVAESVTLSKRKVVRSVDPTVSIGWTATDDVHVKSLDILFARDGVTFDVIVAQGLAGELESYVWTIPETVAKTKRGAVKVVARDAAGNAGEAVSGRLKIR